MPEPLFSSPDNHASQHPSTLPSSIAILSTILWLVETVTPPRTYFLNAGASTVSSYCPGGISVRVYCPVSPESALNRDPVDFSTSRITALGIAAPCGSRTDPDIVDLYS